MPKPATNIGPKMKAAAAYVAAHPDTAILPVAEAIGPNGSRRYGYAAVHRAIRAGIIEATRTPRGWYRLTVAD